jgi:tricorn protease
MTIRLPWAAPLLVLPAVAALVGLAEAQVRPDAVMLRYPDVSQDEIVFRYDGDLWLVPKTGGTARRLTTAEGNESFARFSPDGRRIAFLGGYAGGADLYVLDVAAGAPVRVTYHPTQEILSDWTPDGAELLYASGEIAGNPRADRILRVPAAGGHSVPLPVPYGSFGALDATGTWLAYTPYSREFRTWKRYRGGRAADIWLYNLATGESRNVTADPANDEQPMWHGREVLFRSDRGSQGVYNLYAYDVDAGTTTQLTTFDVADVQFPAVGPSDVVFENGGELYRMDLADPARPYAPVDVVIPGERPQLRPRAHDVSDLVEGVSAGPGGVRLAIEARGDVWNVPVEEGVTRNVTRSDGVAERAPAWSPDGEWIAYLSDRTGEYELTLRRADGKPFEGSDERGERTLTSMGPGWKHALSWSPDSTKIALATSLGELHLYDRASGELALVTTSPDGGPLAVDWSADSGWLAWSHSHSSSRLDAIYLYDVANQAIHEVTSGMFRDADPVFDRDGDFLYLTSARTFQPLYADQDITWVYANSINLCYVPLRADVEDPFAVEDPVEELDEDEDAEEADDEDDGGEGPDSDDAAESGDGGDDEPDDATGDDDDDDGAEDEDDGDDEEKEAEGPMTIDLEGFESRIRLLPVDAGRYGNLIGAEGKLVFVRAPRTGAGDDEAELAYFDLAEEDDDEREKSVLTGPLRGARLTANGKQLVVRRGGDLGVVELAPKQEFEAIDLSQLVTVIEPRAEWAQILRDAWRLFRDFFYDAGMHGVDWDAVGDRYVAALDDCTSRGDVHWLIGEMMSELNVGHAYNRGLPADDLERGSPARSVGLLGCDWELADGAYRIARIFDGGYDADARSPLAATGIDARAGDYLLAVNGIPVDASQAVYAAFEGTAEAPTALTLNAAPTFDGDEREVVLEPLADEADLRYRAWVADNRAKVHELSDGRVGYVHVPDTGINGQNELVRQLLGEMHRDALLVDERWNGGGQIPTRFIELLDRPATNYWALRAGEDWTWPPVGHRGPKAMLINFAAGSGGDCFPYFFRQAGLGKLIGTRTWGGLVGISGNPSLIDGAQPSVPRFAFYELDHTWGVEGHGVEPDVEVIDDPSAHAAGRDPQIEAGVAHLLQELESWTPPEPARPPGANRSGAGITPEDR